METLNFDELQHLVGEWAKRNFGEQKPCPHCGTDFSYRQVLGVCEESGELAHAELKMQQAIRGTKAEHEAAAKDAVGDILIFMADLCARRGWSLQQIAEETLAEVLKRDWKKDPAGGVA